MTNPNKARGDAFERAVVAVLRECGHDVERTLRLGAHDDRGDITGMHPFIIDCKARNRFDLGGWLDELTIEAAVNTLVPVVVVKRYGKGAARAYAVMELQAFAEVMRK